MIHTRPLAKAALLLGTVLLPHLTAQEPQPQKENESANANASAKELPGPHILARRGALPSPGTTYTTTRIFTSNHLALKMTSGGKTSEGTILGKDTFVETFHVLAPGKLRRTLDRTAADGTITLAGHTSRPPLRHNSLLETPVILQQGPEWTATLENGEPFRNQKHDLDTLARHFSGDPAFAAYGDTPRKPGDKWDAGLAAFTPRTFGEFADVENIGGTFTLELLSVKQINGNPCAHLKAVLDLKATPRGTTDGTCTFKGEGEILRSLRDHTDISWKYSATVAIHDPGKSGRPASQVTGPVLVTGTTTLKRP